MLRVLAIGVVLLLPATARAADDSAGPWVLGAASLGAASGTYRYQGPTAAGYTPRRELALETDMHPVLFGLTGAVGYRFCRCAALGVGVDAELMFQSGARLAYASFDSGYLASIGLSGELRPAGRSAFVLWHVGPATAGFSGSTEDIGAPDNVVRLQRLTGYLLSLGFGWSFGVVGPFARVSYARLSADDTTFRPLLFNLGATFQSW